MTSRKAPGPRVPNISSQRRWRWYLARYLARFVYYNRSTPSTTGYKILVLHRQNVNFQFRLYRRNNTLLARDSPTGESYYRAMEIWLSRTFTRFKGHDAPNKTDEESRRSCRFLNYQSGSYQYNHRIRSFPWAGCTTIQS